MKRKIRTSDFKLFFLIVWFFEPAFFSQVTALQLTFWVGKAVACLLFLAAVIINKDRRPYRPAACVVGAILLEAICLGVTIYYGGAISAQLKTFVSVMILVIIDYYLQYEFECVRRVLFFIFELLVYANLVCILLFPEGMYNFESLRNYYLLGHVNDMIIYSLPAIVLASVGLQLNKENALRKRNFKPLLLIAASAFSIVYTWSATSVGGLLILFFVAIVNRRKVRLTALQGIVVGLLFFILIDVLQVQNGIFSIATQFLGRDASFTGRTAVWDRAMLAISERPWLGYGKELSRVTQLRFHFQQPHARYFNALYRGGLVSGLVLLLTYWFSAKRIDRAESSRLSRFIVAGIWAFMLQACFESYWTPFFYLIFLFGERIDAFSNNKNAQEADLLPRAEQPRGKRRRIVLGRSFR